MTLLDANTGGSGAYARGLLRALQGRDDIDISVIAAARSGGAGTLEWMLSGARHALDEHHADLLHSPGFLAPFRTSVPSVITIHDLSLGKMPEGHPLEWRLFYYLVFPRLVRQARAVITPTEVTKRDVVESLKVSADRVIVTPYGVDEQFFRTPARAHEMPDRPTILFAGPPIKRKNLDAVLRVLASASPSTRLGRAHLRITGATAADFPAYRETIESRGLAGRVEWLGKVPYADLPALYAGVDALAYPSFLEGFGFPPLEAMAAGTPVVASNASCLPEVLGDAAILVAPTDDAALAAAIEGLLGDAAMRSRFIEAGTDRARRYTWERCAELTVRVYEDASDHR